MAYQTKYIHVRNYIYFSQIAFIWSSFVYISKKSSYRLKFSYSVQIETIHKPWEKAAAKHFFSSAYVRCNLLRWMFFIWYEMWKTLFFLKVYRYFDISSTTLLLSSLKQVFWKKSVFYIISTMQYNANTKVAKCNYHIGYLLDKLS